MLGIEDEPWTIESIAGLTKMKHCVGLVSPVFLARQTRGKTPIVLA